MAKFSALNTLIELAGKESDEAAKKLANAIRASEDIEQKLKLLEGYRDDYAARFQMGLEQGLSMMGYRNFQIFMDKLDSAIVGQKHIFQDSLQRIEQERQAWQASERKRLSYDTLANRAHDEELRVENKRDQKLMDEHAARNTHYKQ